jgi:hypothetical protein
VAALVDRLYDAFIAKGEAKSTVTLQHERLPMAPKPNG